MQHMVVDERDKARRLFKERFVAAAEKLSAEGCPRGWGRIAWLKKNKLKKLSAEMIRRYFDGSDMPHASRWQYVADCMGTTVANLRGEIDEDDPALMQLIGIYRDLHSTELRDELLRYAKEFLLPRAPPLPEDENIDAPLPSPRARGRREKTTATL